MLISWIVLAVGELSATGLPLTDVSTAVSSPTATPITPGEPSTLVEALIGVTLIAAYLVFARHMLGRRSVRRIWKPGRVGTGRKAA
jgi:hypothetical protein